MVQSLYKTVWQFLKMQNVELSFDSTIPPLGGHRTDLKTYVCTDSVAAIRIIAIMYNIIPHYVCNLSISTHQPMKW